MKTGAPAAALAVLAISIALGGCGGQSPRTLYGFFPSPPRDHPPEPAGHLARPGPARRGCPAVRTLGFFAHVGLRRRDGTPKPALALWDSYRRDGR